MKPFPLVLSLSILALPPAAAWAPETRVGMVDDAIKLMPRSLRTALETHRQDVLRGALQPMVEEDGPAHRAPWAGGTLDGRIETEARALSEMLGSRTSFVTLSEQFGRLAHFVMDASFPPGVSHDGGDARYAHFAAFCEDRRAKFRLVFYGHENAFLEEGDYHGFAVEVMQRAGAEDRELARAYAAAGEPPDAAAFDDRSIPFAVGSSAYSHGVNDVIRVWLTVWREAGGDTGRTPYSKRDEETSNGGR